MTTKKEVNALQKLEQAYWDYLAKASLLKEINPAYEIKYGLDPEETVKAYQRFKYDREPMLQ